MNHSSSGRPKAGCPSLSVFLSLKKARTGGLFSNFSVFMDLPNAVGAHLLSANATIEKIRDEKKNHFITKTTDILVEPSRFVGGEVG